MHDSAAVRRLVSQLCALALLAAAACNSKESPSRSFPFLEKLSPAPAVKTNLVELQQDDGQWVMPAKNYASTRFSALNQINANNVKNLKVTWTFSTGHDRGEEAAPLVVNNTMYVVTPFPNVLYALDLTQPGAPAKWNYQPKNLNSAAKEAPRFTTSQQATPWEAGFTLGRYDHLAGAPGWVRSSA